MSYRNKFINRLIGYVKIYLYEFLMRETLIFSMGFDKKLKYISVIDTKNLILAKMKLLLSSL